MIQEEVKEFASRIGVDIAEFDRGHPLCFRVDGALDFCLEFRRNGELMNEDGTVKVPVPLILSLRFPVAGYDHATMKKFLGRSSWEQVNTISYTMGYSGEQALMMTDIPANARAADIENAIILLKRQYEEIMADEQ